MFLFNDAFHLLCLFIKQYTQQFQTSCGSTGSSGKPDRLRVIEPRL